MAATSGIPSSPPSPSPLLPRRHPQPSCRPPPSRRPRPPTAIIISSRRPWTADARHPKLLISASLLLQRQQPVRQVRLPPRGTQQAPQPNPSSPQAPQPPTHAACCSTRTYDDSRQPPNGNPTKRSSPNQQLPYPPISSDQRP